MTQHGAIEARKIAQDLRKLGGRHIAIENLALPAAMRGVENRQRTSERQMHSAHAVRNSIVSAIRPGPNDMAQPVRPRAPDRNSRSITNITVADDMLP